MIELSREQAARLLVGHSVEVSVSEPWDFESRDGSNRLVGRVVAVVGEEASRSRDEEITLEVTPFEAEGGISASRLVCRRRHVDETGIVEYLTTGREAIVNMSYRDQIPEDKRDPRSSQFLIGSFHLVD